MTNRPERSRQSVSTCEYCGKQDFTSRKNARRWGKIQFPADPPRAYRCASGGKHWHAGHLPAAIINGTISRSDAYAHLRQEKPPVTAVQENTTAMQAAFDRAARLKTTSKEQTVDLADQVETHLADTVGTPLGDESTRRLATLFTHLDAYRTVNDVLVTPNLAKRIVGLNSENNRNHRPTRSDRYARDMIEGRWREQTGQSIVIDRDGKVIDGNHRMHAVAKSGRALRFDFTFGVEPSNIIVIDANAPRTAGDMIKVVGGPDLSKEVAAIVRWVWAWDRNSPTGIGGSITPTPLEIVEKYAADAHRFHAAAERGRDAVKRKLCAGSVAGTAFFLFNRISATASHEFFDAFVSGNNLIETDAIQVLRERLRSRHEDRLTPAIQLAMLVKTWERYNTLDSEGNRVKCYRLQPVKEGKIGNGNFPKLHRAIEL